MVRRNDLEAEVAKLRRELDALRTKTAGASETAATSDAPQPDEESDPKQGTIDWAMSQLEGSELDRLITEFMAEIEGLHEQKPMLTVFGAFVLGYVLGRSH